MPTELEELVEFLHHGNTEIRQIASENLVGYSSTQPALFKSNQLLPVRDLKLLVRDYTAIAKNALTILINLSHDDEVIKTCAEDDGFLETLLKKITDVRSTIADEVAMLLANLAKSDSLKRVISLKRAVPKPVSSSTITIDQLIDCFVKGADHGINKSAEFDYLAYFLADISKHEEGRRYFTVKQKYDDVIPITKLTVFTEHRSHIRRKGVASTIKNVAFEIASHQMLLDDLEVNLLPYVLLPLAGSEQYSEEESAAMPPDLQLLPPDKARDPDNDILVTHLETLLLLTATRDGRDLLREKKIYPIVRETHLHVDDDGVREACDRLVQVLLRDEEEEAMPAEDDDDKILEVI